MGAGEVWVVTPAPDARRGGTSADASGSASSQPADDRGDGHTEQCDVFYVPPVQMTGRCAMSLVRQCGAQGREQAGHDAPA